MSFPISLPNLPEREAIIDALHRATTGIDMNDVALFDSAWVNKEDPIFEMNGEATKGLDAIHKTMFDRVKLLDTTHYSANFRINHKEGTNTASFTAYFQNHHYKTGEGLAKDTKRLVGGGTYVVDVMREVETGLWKVKKWSMKLIWFDGDMSIIMPS